MNKKHHSYYFLLSALALSIIIVYFIAKPFLGPLILSAVFAFLFQPIYIKFLSFFKDKESLSAFFTTILVIVLVLVPVFFLGAQIFKESSVMYQSIINESDEGIIVSIERVLNDLRVALKMPIDFHLDFSKLTKQSLEFMIENFGTIFSSLTKILINIFVFLIAFYFFLKDGPKLKNYFVLLSPLDDKNDEFIVSKLKSAISATVKGNLIIGIIQGSLTGLGFAIFGIPNPFLFGSIAIIAAFLPGVGTSLVLTPAILFLFFSGQIVASIGLLTWGIVAVGLIDNFLGPKLISRGMNLHPLSVFIAVLGGIAFFGPLGFILGPLTVSVCIALVDIYISLKEKE